MSLVNTMHCEFCDFRHLELFTSGTEHRLTHLPNFMPISHRVPVCTRGQCLGQTMTTPPKEAMGCLQPLAAAGLSCRAESQSKVWGGTALLHCRVNATLAGMVAPLGSIPIHRIAPLGCEGAASFGQLAGGAPPLAGVPASSHETLIPSSW